MIKKFKLIERSDGPIIKKGCIRYLPLSLAKIKEINSQIFLNTPRKY